MLPTVHMNFLFPGQVLAVASVHYDMREGETRRPINPRVRAILLETGRLCGLGHTLGLGDRFGSLSVFRPEFSEDGVQNDQIELSGGLISSCSFNAPRLLGKHASLLSSREDGPVLLIWTGEAPEGFEDDEYVEIANAGARIIAGIDRLMHPYKMVS